MPQGHSHETTELRPQGSSHATTQPRLLLLNEISCF